jgi:hypothetical protein
MCKTPCCRPQRSSGTGELIAVIAVIIIAADVLSALLHLLVTLLLIALISTAALAVIALVTWALIRRHRRTTLTGHHPAVLARRAPALPPGYLRAIDGQPGIRLSGTTPPGRALTTGHERLARQRAGGITTYDDRAAVEDLIRILRGHHT